MPASNSAKYAALARDLIEAINNGTYPVGTLLPTELQLSATYAFSRQTVREALRQLANMGLVVRQAGVGTRVQRQHSDTRYTHSVDSFSDLEDYARSLRLVVNTVKSVTASGDLAALIGCREGSRWLRLCGLRFRPGNSQAVAFSEMYLHSGFQGVRQHIASLGGSTIHAMLEREYGETVEEIQQQVIAVNLDAELAQALNEKEGAAAIEIHRRFYGKGRRLVLSGRVVHVSGFSYDSHFVREVS
jgi:GntR family transcriptional regulator